MPYVSGSPLYASADGQPIRYASLDGAELWRAPGAQAEPVSAYRHLDGTFGFTWDIPVDTNRVIGTATGYEGIGLQFYVENWEPILEAGVTRVIVSCPLFSVIQRRVGSNGYAIQYIPALQAGGVSTQNFDTFNARAFRDGWMKIMNFSYGGLVEFSGHSNSIFIGTDLLKWADVPMVGTVLGPDSAIMDARAIRVWNSANYSWRTPPGPPAAEFIGKGNPPVPPARQIGSVPAKTRDFDGRLVDRYGYGMGEIEVHLDVAKATVNSSQVYQSMQNLGIEGYGLHGLRTGSGNITLTPQGWFSKPVGSTVYIPLNGDFNMMGKRIFFAMKPDAAATGDPKFLGASIGTAAGERTNVTWARANNSLQLTRWAGSSFAGGGALPLPVLMSDEFALYELEILPGIVKLWRNGEYVGEAAFPFPDFRVNRFLSGYNTPTMQGLAGDLIAMNTDGSPDHDAAVADIRRHYSTRYNLALAA